MTGLLASLLMTEHLERARENAQRTYDRRRARNAAEQLAVIPPNRWDDRTRQIIATLATISAPSRIDELLDEAFEPPIGGAENPHDMPSPYLDAMEVLDPARCASGHLHGGASAAAACDSLPRPPECECGRYQGCDKCGRYRPRVHDNGDYRA